ncbi:APC family permease [Emcibacter sp.]|uniref:APC family permease n=1 Tax=Emcibacter sp. TaxID=1979954 RepID=UPI002AA90364|nr:amino acid permease [Emcibacter sp.]
MAEDVKVRPCMGFWRTWALVVGMMIGSGIFMMPALLAPFGGLGLMSILVTGGGTLLIALMLSRLTKAIPKVGGPYAYAREGLGDFAAFLTMWGYSISIWTSVAAVAVGFVGYLDVFIPGLAENPVASLIASLGLIWLLVALNIKGVQEASIIQLITTILKILPLLLIGGLGFFHISGNYMPEMNPTDGNPFSALSAAAIMTMWAFVGIECATIPADDVIEPEKTVPRVMFWGTITVTLVYLVSTFGVMLVVPPEVLTTSTSPFSDAATAMMGPFGAKFVAVGAMISMIGALNALILVGAQTPMAAARDKLFLLSFAKLSKNGTPAFSLLVLGVIASVLLMMNYTKGLRGAFEFLLLLSTLSVLIPYAFSAVAELVLLRKVGKAAPLQTTFLSLAAFVYTTWVIIGSGDQTVFWGFILLLVGMPIYAWLHVHITEVEQVEAVE